MVDLIKDEFAVRENEWTISIKELLQNSNIGDNIYFDTLPKCPMPYPQADSKIQRLMRFLRLDTVRKIKLSTHPVQWFFPLDVHFEMSTENQKDLYSSVMQEGHNA